MMTNFFIKPHPALAAFVDNYILSTSGEKHITIHGNWAASNETSVVFYLADQLDHQFDGNMWPTGKTHRNWVVGSLTRSNGFVSFQGCYKTFVIQFKANGFSKIFKIPGSEVTNRIFPGEAVFGSHASKLYEQLLNANDVQAMARFADDFLLHFLHKQKLESRLDGITSISNQLLSGGQVLDVAGYAYLANMSLRNFERRFTEQVGVSPKLFLRLFRFNNAVNTKIRYPEKTWTSLAHEYGYFDQMHLIKDFKDFADVTPTIFIQQNAGMQNEQFVCVKRTAL